MFARVGSSHGKKHFWMVMERLSWPDAAKYCKDVLNSHLAAILNQHEQQAVARYISSLPGP